MSRAATFHHRVTTVLAVVFVLFQVYTAGFGQFSPFVQRGVHVGVALLLAFLKLLDFGGGAGGSRRRLSNASNLVIGLLALASCLYIVVEDERLSTAIAIIAAPHEIALGIALLVIVLEGARRDTGLSMPLLALAMIAYALFGNWIPGGWGHRGFSLAYLVEYLFLGSEGLWGTVTGVSAGLLAIFLIFGSFLLSSGATESMMKLALIASGRSRGGAAKVANLASGVFGMVSGSAVANVVTTGTFTIPAMKRLGYRPAFAAAVEATASSGGQIMPPIMGAGAFIMAELLGIPYLKIAAAAAIPAFLYYRCIWVSIDLEAAREKMQPFEEKDIPRWREVLVWRGTFPLLGTIGVLLGGMLYGYSATLAAFYAVATNLALFLILGPWSWRALAERLWRVVEGMRDAAAQMSGLMSLLVCAQVIIALVGMTGIGIKLSELIISVGAGGGLLAGALLTMAVALMLGMGVPTTAAYLLAAAVCAGPLTKLGVAPLVAHFFIFYGAILSGLTPPVCAAVYAAAAIARTPWWPVAMESLKLAVMKFVLPFYFLYRPAIMLQGSAGAIAWSALAGAAAAQLFAIGMSGYYRRPVGYPLRALCLAAAIAIIPGLGYLDAAGLAVLGTLIAWNRLRRPKEGGDVSAMQEINQVFPADPRLGGTPGSPPCQPQMPSDVTTRRD